MKFSAIAALGSVAAYEANDKMKIDLYYEAQCGACRNQITTNFFTAINTAGFVDMADVTLHPYGNARESAGSDGEWNYTCQHGPAECQWNLLEACAIDYNQNGVRNKWLSFHFIACIERSDSSSNYEQVATECAKSTGQPEVEKLLTCMKGKQGNALEHKIALQTNQLQPSHNFVPWLVADGVHNDTV